MLYVDATCFAEFACIAHRCPDTCCAGWEVDLDPEILEKYRSLPGPLGDEIRSRIVTEDGYTFFRMEEGRCPFLNEKNLCRLILEAGEGCLSTTCREHPRFWEEYGHIRETCLAISCPEAARLLFSRPFRLSMEETEEPAQVDEFLDEELLDALLDLRRELFSLALEPMPIPRRLDAIGETAAEAQGLSRDLRRDIPGFLAFLSTLEFTDNRLKDLLEIVTPDLNPEALYAALPMEAENLLLYFLYRYVLRAVWDGLVLEKALFAVYVLESIFALAGAMPGDLRENVTAVSILFSRETEHSPENLERIYTYLTAPRTPTGRNS